MITFHVFVLTLKITNERKSLCLQKLDMLAEAEKVASAMFFVFKEIVRFDGAISDIFNEWSLNLFINNFFQKENLLIGLRDRQRTLYKKHLWDQKWWRNAVSCFMFINKTVNHSHQGRCPTKAIELSRNFRKLRVLIVKHPGTSWWWSIKTLLDSDWSRIWVPKSWTIDVAKNCLFECPIFRFCLQIVHQCDFQWARAISDCIKCARLGYKVWKRHIGWWIHRTFDMYAVNCWIK